MLETSLIDLLVIYFLLKSVIDLRAFSMVHYFEKKKKRENLKNLKYLVLKCSEFFVQTRISHQKINLHSF